MNEIKSHILEFIWSEKSVDDFEQWAYAQNPLEFERLIGEKNYVKLISYDFNNKTVEVIKKFIKTVLPDSLILEFEGEFAKKKSRVIKGKCIKKIALDYYDKIDRNWGVQIGKEYEFLIIKLGIERGNHSGLVNYVDKNNDFSPSGYIPIELFDLNLTNIPECYHKVSNSEHEITIEIKSFSEKHYKPTQYSFWEDYYDEDEKALKTYFSTIKELGITNVW